VKWDLVIFDNDGVLVDSERLANRVLSRLLSRLGVPTTFEESVDTYLGGTIDRVRALVETEIGRRLPDDFEDRYYRDVFAAFDAGLAAVEGVVSVLDDLEAAGIRYCVASSGSHERIARSLRQTGLWERFRDRVFSADDVAAGKPEPDLFLHAVARMGADPEASVVVEDSPLGVQAAVAAAIPVIGFAAVTPAERLSGAQGVCADMAAVGDLLLRGRPIRA
jgi:HAD superfamily hydrolase (TIGR01509 family)